MHQARGTLALTIRSLRVDARQWHLHVLRGLLLLAMLGALWIGYEERAWRRAGGLTLFTMLMMCNVVCLVLVGMSYFATSITEEKEEMTLGLLRMADLGALSILLGKLLPRLINTLLLIAVQVPFTLLSVTLGGVTVQQVFAAYVSLAAFAVFLAGLGLFVSVISPRSTTANGIAAVFLVAYLLAPWILKVIVTEMAASGWMARTSVIVAFILDACDWVISTNAFSRISLLVQPGFSGALWTTQPVSNLIGGVVAFLLAWRTFGWATRNEVPPAPPRPWLSYFRLRRNKRLRRRWSPIRSGRAWSAALVWKDFFFLFGGPVTQIIKAVCYFGLAFLIWSVWTYFGMRVDRDEIAGILMAIGGVAFLIETPLVAGRLFSEEIRNRTLSTLVMLPQSLTGLLAQKVVAGLITLIPSVSCFSLGVLCIFDDFVRDFPDVLDEEGFWYSVTSYVFMVTLTCLLSVTMRWGAFPIAFLITYVAGSFFMSLLMMATRVDEAILVLMSMGFATASVVMIPLIGRIIANKAAQ